jgi:hypothetical protein
MKRALTIILAIAAVHFALMYFTMEKTISHNLDRTLHLTLGLGLIGSPSPDTSFSKLTAGSSAVLTQPVLFLLDLLPAAYEPKEATGPDHWYFALLFWLLMALNSVLWGTTIWLIWYAFGRYTPHRLQPARAG